MKEIYDWVPWFKELGERIAKGGEQYLIDKAKTIPWKDDDSKSPLLKYGDNNIDPFLVLLHPGEPKQEPRKQKSYFIQALSAHSS